MYSCFTDPREYKGDIDEEWARQIGAVIEPSPLVTVMANGAKAVGKVFVREAGCIITDDVIGVLPRSELIHLDYLAEALRSAIASEGFLYEAKLFTRRLRTLSIVVPVDTIGDFDLARQAQIAEAVNRFDAVRARLIDIGAWTKTARLATSLDFEVVDDVRGDVIAAEGEVGYL